MSRVCHVSRMLGCNIYVSEGRSRELVDKIKASCKYSNSVALVNCFQDTRYNRTGLTLVGTAVRPLAAAAAEVSKTALSLLDLQQHTATHPRIGVVDHISCNPLGAEAELCSAAEVAQSIGRSLGEGEHAVPVMLYGAAHSAGQTLASIRRVMNYFKGSSTGLYAGAGTLALPDGLKPDFGPSTLDPRHGIAVVGACPWVVNYNVLLLTKDMQSASSIAKALSSRGGGLACVEAMALQHEEGIEVACNLLDTDATAPQAVLQCISDQAAWLGIDVGPGYTTNQSPEALCRQASEQMATAIH
ncbi:hypothetical protein CVIRNUC_002217 [Coccomyxa viridis]|uniref:glutamate formimidoyltransferase n=1 Tax=Coccomyxa viridis TaxID=1274662 RepID=A0AAV1HYT3_9CHLO|nr:hypothetical protein CVIRNUC_002217 [Coccomyxa viridis]